MKEAQQRRKRGRQSVLWVIAAFAAIVILGVSVFLRFYNGYIDGVLYRERLSQMQEVTSQLFKGLEEVVQNQWDNVDGLCGYLELGRPKDMGSLLTFLNKQSTLNGLRQKQTDLVVVDNLGRYLTQDGWQGTLGEMDLLLDDPEKLSFASKSMTSSRTHMYFLKRLSAPIPLEDNGRTVTLAYYGVCQDMEELNPYFSCEAYHNSNSVYVLNSQGLRIFQGGQDTDLLHGYSAFTVLRNADYLHNNSFDQAKEALDTQGRGYANTVLDGREYYYSLYKMNYSAWTLLFLVPSDQVATNVVSMVNTTMNLILAFAVALLMMAALAIFLIMRYQQKLALDAERRNSERLAEALQKAERAEQAAKKANQAKSDFLANMSHDIRTPMNAIVGIAKLMEHEENDPQKMDSYIRKMQASSRHLLGLINDVLDMSKIESAEVKLNKEPVSLAQQIAQVDTIIRPQTQERHQTFLVRVHEIRHEFVIGDSVRLRQVFINLLSNAVKYTPSGGTITLDLRELPGDKADQMKLKITVSDTGYGMSQEFVQHIFEPFTRAENSTTNRVQGTGLGMAITKSIVDLKGGTISVQSEENKGSTFEVILPFAINDRAECRLDAKAVLLVAKDRELVRNVQAALGEHRIPFAAAAGEGEAKALLQKLQPDVILLSGYPTDRVSALREAAPGKALLLCCEYVSTDEAWAALDGSGVDGILPRPFFYENLTQAVERLRGSEDRPEDREGAGLKGMRFLCAEDNALNAEVLSALLDMNGASCTIYPDGKQLLDAFASVKEGMFDAILMDVQMPVMNGLEATKAIRTGPNPLGKTIPIIAMTANAFSEDVQSCLEAGMNAHVSKPLDISALERTLKAVLGSKFSGGGTPVHH